MELQVDEKEHLRHLILFEFNRGSNGADAARNICAVYGEGFTNMITVKRAASAPFEPRLNSKE